MAMEDLTVKLNPLSGDFEPSGLLWVRQDKQGEFRFPKVSAGSYKMFVQFRGDYLLINKAEAAPFEIEVNKTTAIGKVRVSTY